MSHQFTVIIKNISSICKYCDQTLKNYDSYNNLSYSLALLRSDSLTAFYHTHLLYVIYFSFTLAVVTDRCSKRYKIAAVFSMFWFVLQSSG